MNKKEKIGIILTIIFAITFGIFLVTSNRKTLNNNKVKTTDTLEKSEDNSKEIITNKILVVYFSKSGGNYGVGNVEVGNTALMASYITDYLNADSFEIIPTKPYPYDYKETTEQAKKEQKDASRPEIKNKIENFKNYSTIFIGYPIWWGDMPMIIYTFLESYDFTNKTIIPFNTHEGSGNAGTYSKIISKLPKSKVNKNGLALQGKVARTEEGKLRTISWLEELGY